MKPDGVTWIIGTGPGRDRPYTIGRGFDEAGHPSRLLLTAVPDSFAGRLREQAEALGVEVIEVGDVAELPVDEVDDIVLLGPDPDTIEAASPYLARFGVFAIIADEPLPRKVEIDIGRIHYDRWLYVGGQDPDIARAYDSVPVRSELKPGGRAWFVGAGGPMGRLHVQRAIEIPNGPEEVFCTARSNDRLPVVESLYRADAEAKGIGFDCASLADTDYRDRLDQAGQEAFDDIIALAPSVAAIEEAAEYLAPEGVMNIFAGVKRGSKARLDLSDVYLNGKRFIGHSGLTTKNMRIALEQVKAGEFSANRQVAAVGSLGAFRAGLRAVKNGEFSGTVVIFPHIKELPLTPLPDLQAELPAVYAKLRNGREWTREAEEVFLRLTLM
jgi:hypothetical protein